jgi:hypothetical protein
MPLACLSGDMILSVEGFTRSHKGELLPILGAPIGLRIEIAASDVTSIKDGEGETIPLYYKRKQEVSSS